VKSKKKVEPKIEPQPEPVLDFQEEITEEIIEAPVIAHEEIHTEPVSLSVEMQPSGSATQTKEFPSLYDTIPTTFGAIVLGGIVIGAIQLVVKKIFDREKKEHRALTQFVTSMFALIVGIWIADKLIAGPTTDLLFEQESRDVLVFIKDITLMVFSYYFGVKAQAPKED